MSKVVELRKMGMDFLGDESQYSDLGNFRLRTSFVDRNGVLVMGDFMHGNVFEYKFKNGKERVKPKIISRWGLACDFQRETPDGTYTYTPRVDMSKYRFTKKDILLFIHDVTGDYGYTEVKIID